MEDAKRQAQMQWNTDPCGAITAANFAEGSTEFFEAARRYRYGDYAPWMLQAIGFDRFQGKRVLEIGPGLGTDLLQFGSRGAECYAVDLAQRHLVLTRKNFQLHGLTVPCFLGDAEVLPFKGGTFDCVYAFGVVHSTPNTELAVAEIHRVLKDGGKAIIGIYHRNSAFYWMSTMLFRGVLLMGLMRRGYRRLLSEIEFRSPDSDASPLVKVYSRKQIRALFGRFRSTKVETCHLEFNHFLPLRGLLRLLPVSLRNKKSVHSLETAWQRREFIERLSRYCGWFVIVEAEK
ncbi:MAG: class I SAM-dependent methyltransferase [Nitrospiraceae bacterium]